MQAKIQLDMITSLKTDSDIKCTLERLPNGLDATYESILTSISSRFPLEINRIKTMLEWLVLGHTLMTASQLAEIVAIGPEDTALSFDRVATDPEDVIHVMSQLIITERNRLTTVIKLAHYSIEEFLCSEVILQGSAKQFFINKQEAHCNIAERCLQYLSFKNFDIPLQDLTWHEYTSMTEEYALLRYVSLNWHHHLRESSAVMNNDTGRQVFEKRIRPRIDWFLNGHKGSNHFLLWQRFFDPITSLTNKSPYLPLYFALHAGLTPIVDILLPPFLPNMNTHLEDGSTCLTAAASGNQVDLARSLLKQGAKVNYANDRKKTPLHCAAEAGAEEMVDLLLEWKADPHARSESGSTPFYLAARSGSTYILRRLHDDHGSEVDVMTWDLWTPLMEAVEKGHEDAVDLLLQWGADPLHLCYGKEDSPLSLARFFEFENIMNKLKAALTDRITIQNPETRRQMRKYASQEIIIKTV
jgi:hypothetical protein